MTIENFKKTFDELCLLLHVYMYSIGNNFYNVIRKILNFYKISDHFVTIIALVRLLNHYSKKGIILIVILKIFKYSNCNILYTD